MKLINIPIQTEFILHPPIFVIEKTDNIFYKVYVDGNIGYMSSAYLKKQLSNDKYTGNYLYQTSLKYSSGPPLRTAPSLDAIKIKKCPVNKPIFVIEKTDGIFYKVYVEGTVGYMSSSYLKRQ
ncbi:SH3 domain-containing protein [Zunongwangia sp. F363]|uniref:SH3 domain-containing protein n=1 Tax=Autumnicola tepida TaxID=3075595 RepID=A0ABU3C8U3_9FLAO|nr:SH3 domain-containing protein [Zunongwangia sp. F363]MDT0642737.1 SH3 domain-containing protein [Zunongwangia sp. F363]